MRRPSLRVMFATIFVDLLGFGLVIPYVPAVARALGASDALAPLLGAVYFLMQFLAVPLWGRLSDRIGRRPVFLISYAAAAIGMLGYALAPSLAMAFAARAFAGFFTSHILMAQAYVGDMVPADRRARAMGVLGVAFGVGFLVGPPLGGVLGELPGLRHPGAITGLVWTGLSLVNFLIALLWLGESRRPGRVVDKAPMLGDLARALRLPGLPAALLVSFLFFFWMEGMQQTFANFTADAFGMGLRQTGLVLLWIGVVGTVIQGGLISRLVKRHGERRLVIVGCALEAVGFLAIALAPSMPGLFVAGFVGALGSGLVLPCVSSYVSRCADADAQGLVLGAYQSTTALSRILGPLFAGLLYQGVGHRGPYWVGGIGLFVTAVVALRLRRLD